MFGFAPFSAAPFSALPAAGRLRVVEFSVDQTQALSFAVARSMDLAASIDVTEQVLFDAMSRAREIDLSITEAMQYGGSLARQRPSSFVIVEDVQMSFSINRLVSVALDVAQMFDFTFAIDTLKGAKLFQFNIDQTHEHTFSDFRRIRRVVTAINQTVVHVMDIARTRGVPFTVEEATSLSLLMARSRQFSASLAQYIDTTVQLARRRNIEQTIEMVQEITFNLAKIKLMGFVVQQAVEHSDYYLTRARAATVTIESLTDVQASFNRARAFITSVDSTTGFEFEFNRLRQQAFSIAQTHGMEVAIARIRTIVQSISNTTDMTFTLSVFSGDPSSMRVVVQWEQWTVVSSNEFGTTLQLSPREQVLEVMLRGSTNVVIQDDPVVYIVIPDNAL